MNGETQEAGKYLIVWDGTVDNRRLVNGVYFLKLTNGENEVIKKILVLR